MPIYIDVDTAVAVPVNFFPLTDSTDFKTRETAVAHNAAGMDLVWNFVTTAGVMTQTAVTPTTGGDYDWTHVGDGMYKIEIPASGGASINNTEEGHGWFSGVCDAVLPWVSPLYIFRAAALNNSLIDAGTTGLLGPSVAGRTLGVESDGDLTKVNTLDGHTPQTGDVFPLASTEIAEIKAKTDNLPSDPADQSLIVAATDAIMGRLGAPSGASVSADIATRATPAQVNSEVLDVLNVDTFAQPGQESPPATTTLANMIRYLFKAFRNKKTETSSEFKIFADNETTVDHKATVSDDGSTLTVGELGTGP